MKGTRTRTRTHITPPLQRRTRVAPVGCARSGDFLEAGLYLGRSALVGHSYFRAGGQRGLFSTLEAESS